MFDIPGVPCLGECRVSDRGFTSAVDHEDEHVGLDGFRNRLAPGRTVARRLTAGVGGIAGNFEPVGGLEVLQGRLVESRPVESSGQESRIALHGFLNQLNEPRFADVTRPRDGDPHRRRPAIRGGGRPRAAPGQASIAVGPDRQPTTIKLDQVQAQPVHIRAEEPAQQVLLHVLPRRFDHQLLGAEPDQAGDRTEDRQQIGVNVVRPLDVAGDLDGLFPVARRNHVGPRHLSAERGKVFGGKFQGGEDVHHGDVAHGIVRERVVVRGQHLGKSSAGVDIDVELDQAGEGNALGPLRLGFHQRPGVAVDLGEGSGGVPIDRRQEFLVGLGPARREISEDNSREEPDQAGDQQPVFVVQPERSKGHVRQHGTGQEHQENPRSPVPNHVNDLSWMRLTSSSLVPNPS